MEQKIDIQPSTRKIYKDKTIWIGTFLGGPLVAGYLISENFKAFDEFDKAKRTWIYAIIATIVIFGGVFLIPENVKIPNQIIPLIYTGIASYLFQHFQGENVTSHINSGGQLHSWWRVIGVGVIGLAITLIAILGLTLLLDSTTSAGTDTKTYGVMEHEIIFDNNNITENEVNKLADNFTKTTFFDEAATKYVYAKKVNSTYEISISVVKEIENDNQALQPFIDLRTDMQTFYPNNKIVFKLVVDNLDNVIKEIK